MLLSLNTAKATGGDSVTTDGTYWYHTFLSSGTFTPTEALTADYLSLQVAVVVVLLVVAVVLEGFVQQLRLLEEGVH
jgi:hypothetical protein